MKSIMKKPVVVLIDDDPVIHKFVQMALDEDCTVICFSSGEKALVLLESCHADLILLDVVMPTVDGFATLHSIKENKVLNHIPVIFLTGQSSVQFELKALGQGAVDYVNKPFTAELLKKRVEIHLSYARRHQRLLGNNQNLQQLVDEKVRIIKELQDALIYTLADLVEMRDNFTGRHVLRTQDYYRLILQHLTNNNMCKSELESLDYELLIEASQLHDIGKVAIPDAILLKPGPLTIEEFETMKEHTWLGYNVIQRAMEMTENKEFLRLAAEMVLSHHERWDGTGYPQKLSGTAIPLSGRIMAVVDVYDALISERPYKKGMTHENALRILVEESGTHFDPTIVSAFLSLEGEFRRVGTQIAS